MSFITRTSPGISEADAKELDNRLGNKFPVSGLPGEHGLGTLLYHQLPTVAEKNKVVKLFASASTELTIASGAITATQGVHTVDTQGDAASDDLDTINGLAEGDLLLLRPNNAARTVVLKHGTGNIFCPGGQDVSLAEATDWALLSSDGTNVVVIAKSILAVPAPTPAAHAASHTDGSDDIQPATNAQKGLATAAQITALEAATATIAAATTDTGVGAGNAGKLVELDGDGKLDGRDVGTDGTKLDGIEALADVTDATNVDAAGAVMNSDTSTAAMQFVVDEDNMASDSATKIPTQQSVKAYVDAAVVGLYDHKGGYDANTNTPDLDTAPSGVKKGDAYTVSAAGTFFTEALEVGDVIIADQDNPTALAHWTRVNKNIDAATTTSPGIVELATDGENAANVVVQGNDSRLSDARTPLAHAASHTNGSDDIQSATPAQKGLMTAAYAAEVTANTAALAASAATSIGLVRHILVEIANGATRDIDTALPPGTWEPVDAWVVNEEASVAADSIQLVAVGIGAITEDMSSLAADQIIIRPTTFNRTQLVGGTNALRCAVTAAAGAAPAQTAHFLLRQVA